MIIYDDLPAISIYDLMKVGAQQRGVQTQWSVSLALTGHDNGQITIGVDISHPQPFITISQISNGQNRDYRVNIIAKPLQVNSGSNWYFICPVTGIHCRKLFYYRGSFQHRKAIPGIYSRQLLSGNQRKIISSYNNINVLAALAQKAGAPYFRPVYAGEPTKIYRKISKVVYAGKELSDVD